MNVGIIGTGSYLPSSVTTSRELAARIGVEESWILERTGIRERRIAAPDEATSDLAAEAGRRAIHAAGLKFLDIDLILLATGTADQPAPATACFVQAKLGASKAVAFDVMAACSGFVYALRIATDMLTSSSDMKYALIIGADAYSRFANYNDRRTCVIIGDGAGAVVLGKVQSGGILGTTIGSDGSVATVGQIPAGGSRKPATVDTVANGLHYFTMDGRKIRDIVIDLLPRAVNGLLSSINLNVSELDLIVPHQANVIMVREWSRVLGVDPDQVHETASMYGNTGAASLPVTLDDAIRLGRLSMGDLVLFVAFGGGVTWGSAVVQWNH